MNHFSLISDYFKIYYIAVSFVFLICAFFIVSLAAKLKFSAAKFLFTLSLISILSSVFFFLLFPINFFYFSAIEVSNSKINLKGLFGQQMQSLNRNELFFFIDSYRLNPNTPLRRRLVVQDEAICFYSQIIDDKELDNLISSASFNLSTSVSCKPAYLVESSIWDTRLIIGVVSGVIMIFSSSLINKQTTRILKLR